MQPKSRTPVFVLLRDLFIFQFKLVLDGLKGFGMVWLSVAAVLVDLVLDNPDRGRYFYATLRLSEKIDLWLNLYAPARRAESNQDGLFGESPAGAPTFVGRMEGWVRSAEPAARIPGPTV
ncbi:MAG TPA: hypothetical protein VE913_00035 [Longimicrobium sp.]|nr:hypothetical protein [Longimicrobium sp.]